MILAFIAHGCLELIRNLLALGPIDLNILAPLGNVVLIMTRQTSGKTRHQPRVTFRETPQKKLMKSSAHSGIR